MKKILLTIFVFFTAFQQFVCADEILYKNNLRSLFQNNEAIIYGLNIRTFNAKDLNGNEIIDYGTDEESGNFVNAVKRLDELQSMGINAVHLLPITPTGKIKALGTAGSVYSLSDFSSLNPDLKDKKSTTSITEEAKKFINECHKRNIKVIIDLPSCGSYDLYLKQPDLFVQDRRQQSVVPADWTDVRLFRAYNKDGTLNEDLIESHKKFIDMIQELGADGIRADVATIKPYEFWVRIIRYAREKDAEFLFLAEASDSWNEPASEYAPFTNYKKLLQAGFDGFYGSYFNLKNWKNASELKSQIQLIEKINKENKDKKSVIGSFATHDEQSPVLTGGEPLAVNMMWLNATLPLNPYYIDGFISGDKYIYPYANKKAPHTYTDDDYYYVHNGQLDIFNFSRKPDGKNSDLILEFYKSIKFREYADELIRKGSFKLLSTNNPSVFAFARTYNDSVLLVIFNRDVNNSQNAVIKVPGLNTNTILTPVKTNHPPKILKGKITAYLSKGDTIVFFIDKFKL